VVAAGFAEDADVEVAAWFGPFVVLFSEHGADEARLLRRHRAHARDARRWHVRPAPDGGGRNGCPLAALRALDSVAELVAVGVTRCGDCVVTVSCPACGKCHVHGLGAVSSPARDARTAGSSRPTTTTYRAQPGSCWRTLILGRGAPATTDAPQEPVSPE
jgi:hypothetical protein